MRSIHKYKRIIGGLIMNNISLLDPNFIVNYLEKKGIFIDIISATPINLGASGAKLIDITDRQGRYVIKHTNPSLRQNHNNMLSSYERELEFYSLFQQNIPLPIPKIIYIERNSDYGNIIVFPYYKQVEFSLWSKDLQLKAMDFCAKLHSLDTNLINKLGIELKYISPDSNELNNSLIDWNYVLNQHDRYFDKEILKSIFMKFSDICNILNGPPHNICHGDFHANNIMLNNEDIVVCDWQCVGIGKGAGDISFFISRGKAEGITINEDNLIDYYCERLSNYTKTEINKIDIYNVINASTVFTSFLYWAYYLKNADLNTVSEVYNKMVNSFISLNF
jgi:aminoglycoside phosphotransferase (APT) family kinase protein